MAGQNNNPHAGHRKRLRDVIAAQGVDGLPPHNVLEYLLFHTIPRQDVNELAHRLIERFGSFSGVLDADYEELKTVAGVSDTTALFLHTLPAVFRLYHKERKGGDRSRFQSLDELRDYMARRLMFRTDEALLLGCLNPKGELFDLRVLAEGSPKQVQIPVREIVSLVLALNASAVIIGHNHPGGFAVPSRDDIQGTQALCQLMRSLHVELIDHIITASDEDYVSLRDSGYLDSIFSG